MEKGGFTNWWDKNLKQIILLQSSPPPENFYYSTIWLKSAPDFPGGSVVKDLPYNWGTWVQSLVQEDPTCHGATKLVHHNYWSHKLQSLCSTKREATTMKSLCTTTVEESWLTKTRERPWAATKTQHSHQKKKKKKVSTKVSVKGTKQTLNSGHLRGTELLLLSISQFKSFFYKKRGGRNRAGPKTKLYKINPMPWATLVLTEKLWPE